MAVLLVGSGSWAAMAELLSAARTSSSSIIPLPVTRRKERRNRATRKKRKEFGKLRNFIVFVLSSCLPFALIQVVASAAIS
jgi:hypothetical protein